MTARSRAAVETAVSAIEGLMDERRRTGMAWLRDCDISIAQLHAVNVLLDGDLSVGALAESLSISAPSASGIVDRLEERGFVQRVRSEGDRRSVRVSLSTRGREFGEMLHSIGGRQLRDILAELSDADLVELARLLLLLRNASAKVTARQEPPAAAAEA